MSLSLLSFPAALRVFCFPPICLACRAVMESPSEPICSACRSTLRPVRETDAIYHRAAYRLCGDGLIAGMRSLYHFEKGGPVQALVHTLKYGDGGGIGLRLGKELGEQLLSQGLPADIRGIVPVPLHRVKERERGYNQSVYLARGISREIGAPVLAHEVMRVRYTDSQTTLTIEQRRDNVAEAFGIRRKGCRVLNGGVVILVDDVITTGSTVRSCADVLRGAGVDAVYACSICLAE
jgi:competence protein ComFC